MTIDLLVLMLKHTEEITIHFSEEISDEKYWKSYRYKLNLLSSGI